MAWQQIAIRLDADQIPRTEALLKLAGAEAVAVSDAGNEPVLEPEPGMTPVWPRAILTALFDAALDLDRIPDLLPAGIDPTAIEITTVAEKDWIDAWRESIAPIVLGDRLEVVPLADAGSAGAIPRVVLGMGLAFGTGRHPTTRLCLEWLAERDWSGATMLDYGSGSGILALAALRLGARFALATDNDDQALTATRENGRVNHLQDRLWIGPPESLPDDNVDLLMANILAGTLCGLAQSFAARQEPGARIALSGVLESQADEVLDAFSPFYRNFETRHLDGWVMHAGVRTDRIDEVPRRA